jgi:HlyD family secretion protein
MKKKYIKYIVIGVLLIVGLFVFNKVRKNSKKPEWRTEKPTSGTIREVVTATGSLNPYVLVEVGTEVSGKIEKLYKDFNDKVRKGELLAKLDTEILSTSLESARTDLNKASVSRDEALMDYNISKELFAKQMTSEYEMKKAEFTYKQAQQNLAAAQLKLRGAEKNLRNASITSPIDGVIVARDVNEGQTVAASFSSPTLFTIANNLDQMQITANVDEADIGSIKTGMPVEFSVDAYAGEQFTGTVQQIRLNSSTEQNVVSYSVIIDAANPEHKLLPGMTTNVTIVIQSKQNVTRIPESATRFTPSKEVWELFGLKWEDDLVSNARKKAIQNAMALRSSAAADATAKTPARDSLQSGKPETAKRDSSAAGQRKPGMPGRQGMVAASGGPSAAGFPGSNNPSAMAAFGGSGRSGMGMIWVLKGKTPELITVRTGISDGAYLEILSPLDPNTVIITGVIYKDASQITGNSALQGRTGMGPRF